MWDWEWERTLGTGDMGLGEGQGRRDIGEGTGGERRQDRELGTGEAWGDTVTFPLGDEVLLQARRFHLPCPSQALQCSLTGPGDTGDTGDCPGARVNSGVTSRAKISKINYPQVLK